MMSSEFSSAIEYDMQSWQKEQFGLQSNLISCLYKKCIFYRHVCQYLHCKWDFEEKILQYYY